MEHTDYYKLLRDKFKNWSMTKKGKDNKWFEYLLFAPDFFHLMCKLTFDDDVPTKEKAKLAGAIAYFVSPIDLVPEILVGPAGYIDDIALAAYVLNSVMENAGEEVLVRHWAGDEDVLVAIRKVLGVANEMVGTGLWKILTSKVDNKEENDNKEKKDSKEEETTQ